MKEPHEQFPNISEELVSCICEYANDALVAWIYWLLAWKQDKETYTVPWAASCVVRKRGPQVP
jgi:hypothetical protein